MISLYLRVAVVICVVALAIPVLGQAQSIRNYGNCPPAIMALYEDLNRKAEAAEVEAKIRFSKIRGVACLTGSWGSEVSTVYVRAWDGREMQWKPSDGTRELQRMMLLGR